MKIKTAAFYVVMLSFSAIAYSHTTTNASPKRPAILFNRWQEDWSVLADPRVPREPLDNLKYIPLSANPKTYLSLGADWRNRYEYNNAMDFGVGPTGAKQSYDISRMEVHADLHIADQVQVFAQLQNDNAPWKKIILPVDEDRLDLEQGFITVVEPLGGGTFKFRVGRQQMAFDMQRFISVRNGPNVRQSFDAIWFDYELAKWRLIAFYSYPVVSRNLRCFDDYSSNDLTYGGIRAERKINNTFRISSYFSRYTNANAVFLTASGHERRNILDIRLADKTPAYDWDLETMGQTGNIDNKQIRAWAIGSVSGYTFENIHWMPRIGLQFDAASGNGHKHGGTLGTFNPLFPNGPYFSLAGYTGYTNLFHLKPSLTVQPNSFLSAMIAFAAQWRETTADAVYIQPNVPVPGTAGSPGAYTGNYVQGRVDWLMQSHVHTALEVVRFNIADVIRKVGGHNSTYVGVEVKLDW